MNAGGAKLGVGLTKDGKIEHWQIISPEETSQEIVAAVATNDFARLQALMIAENEMKALDLPADQAAPCSRFDQEGGSQVRGDVRQGGPHGQDQLDPPGNTSPAMLPRDQTGAKNDIFKYAQGTIQIETNGKNDWLQTGEMIQVGLAWRIIDAPVPGLENVAAAAPAERKAALRRKIRNWQADG